LLACRPARRAGRGIVVVVVFVVVLLLLLIVVLDDLLLPFGGTGEGDTNRRGPLTLTSTHGSYPRKRRALPRHATGKNIVIIGLILRRRQVLN
jgi:hypothetical protein